MGPAARPAFANLLANLDGGVLRIGGSSQDVMRFSADEPNTDELITPADLADVRATLDTTRGHGRTGWVTVLGTAMSPATSTYPFRTPEHTRAFVEHGVEPAFDGARREVAGIELGNEPDLSYKYDVGRYLSDFDRWRAAGGTAPYPTIVPASSNAIAPWTAIRDRTVQTRFFWDWPQILDATAPTQRANAGPLGAWAADHFYPLARTCSSDPYRCPTIPALLDPGRRDNLDYLTCGVGALGVNFHNAERNAFFRPEEGNAYYNAIDFDPSAAMGAPTAAPEYYALLLFARFAQGTSGLRPVAVSGAPDVSGWRVEGTHNERRLFLINRSDTARTVSVRLPGRRYLVDRMSPYDPDGAGRELSAPAAQIDGRSVTADGHWPGFDPTPGSTRQGVARIRLDVGSAVVIRVP